MQEAGPAETEPPITGAVTRERLHSMSTSPGDPRTLQAMAADRLRRELAPSHGDRPWSGRAADGVDDARSFREALAKWARGYSMKYRHTPGTKPTVAEARQALRRWSATYWTRSPLP